MKIGTFILDQDGVMHGKVYGLGLGSTDVVFEQATSQSGKMYFKIIADPLNDAYEVGAAFPKEKNGMTYHSVTLESPALAAPLHAGLFHDKNAPGQYSLVWDRPVNGKDLKADASATANGQPQHQGQKKRTTSQQPGL